MFHTKVVEKIKTHILRSVTFFWKSCHFWGHVKNMVSQTGHRWHYNMAHAHFMLVN